MGQLNPRLLQYTAWWELLRAGRSAVALRIPEVDLSTSGFRLVGLVIY